MSGWSGSTKAPAVKRKPCRKCGTEVDEFRDQLGIDRQLNTTPVPVTWDLAHPSIRNRVWEDRGPILGWCLKFRPHVHRGWRELRLGHVCADDNEREQKGKREHKRETEK